MDNNSQVLQTVVFDLAKKLQQRENIGETAEVVDRLLEHKHNFTQTSFGELDLILHEHDDKMEKLGNEIKSSCEGLW